MDNIFVFAGKKGLNKTNSKQAITKRNSKLICSYDMLRARTFRVRRKSLRAHYAHAYERTRNFIRSRKGKFLLNG